MKNYHQKPNTCKICENELYYKYTLKTHNVSNHTPEFKTNYLKHCRICKKPFNSSELSKKSCLDQPKDEYL